jgi:hypothetical protein
MTAERTRARGRPAAPEAIALGHPTLMRPTGSVELDIIELLVDALIREVADHTVATPPGSVTHGRTA